MGYYKKEKEITEEGTIERWETDEVSFFCSKHGDVYKEEGICNICKQPLVKAEVTTIRRLCLDCKTIFIAPVGFFIEHKSKCNRCGGRLYSNMELDPIIIHVKVGVTWDNKDRGSVIMEKNSQLKRKWAGYEHEIPQLRKKMMEYGQKVLERRKGNGT